MQVWPWLQNAANLANVVVAAAAVIAAWIANRQAKTTAVVNRETLSGLQEESALRVRDREERERQRREREDERLYNEWISRLYSTGIRQLSRSGFKPDEAPFVQRAEREGRLVQSPHTQDGVNVIYPQPR
jgi:hypothetical protein